MEHMHDESTFVRKESCPSCGSRDNLARYSDGHGYCFGCEYREPARSESDPLSDSQSNREAKPVSEVLRPYREGTVTALPARGISEATCSKYGYRIGKVNGRTVHIAPYYKDQSLVGLKVRDAEKNFSTLGEMKAPQFFGQHLQSQGKMLVVTEGEIDCLSVAQAMKTWPVVSLPSGAASACKAFKNNLEFLSSFETVVIFFDMDEPGQKAAKECAEVLPPGKAKIVSITGAKDANDLLKAGREGDIVNAVWRAKEYRPDGLVSVDDVLPDLDKEIEEGLPWWLPGLTALTYGRRWGEIYAFGAGTGIGKTDFLTQQIEYDLHTLKQSVGLIFLEQKPLETLIRTAGKHVGKRLHVPDGNWTKEERKEAVAKMRGMVTLYDSFGQTDWDVVANKIRFMAVSEGKRIFYLDHLTAMADTADEKGSLEQIMKEMAGLAQELQIIIHFVSHLSTPEGKSHEEGGRVSSKHFKGSRAIQFWSYFMFGLERNTQADDPAERSITTFRIVKDRFTGQATGETLTLGYDKTTGRLFPTEGFKPESVGENYGF